jgi:hypothetical protein
MFIIGITRLRNPNKSQEGSEIQLTQMGAGAAGNAAAVPDKKSSTSRISKLLNRLKGDKTPSPGTPSSGAGEDLLTPDDRQAEKQRIQAERRQKQIEINRAESAKLRAFLDKLCEDETRKAQETAGDAPAQAATAPK